MTSSWPWSRADDQRLVRGRGAPVEARGQRHVAGTLERGAQGQEPGQAVRGLRRARGDREGCAGRQRARRVGADRHSVVVELRRRHLLDVGDPRRFGGRRGRQRGEQRPELERWSCSGSARSAPGSSVVRSMSRCSAFVTLAATPDACWSKRLTGLAGLDVLPLPAGADRRGQPDHEEQRQQDPGQTSTRRRVGRGRSTGSDPWATASKACSLGSGACDRLDLGGDVNRYVGGESLDRFVRPGRRRSGRPPGRRRSGRPPGRRRSGRPPEATKIWSFASGTWFLRRLPMPNTIGTGRCPH